jgi:cation diffusion facilitator CzcD-associated flavoprotein CzcO
VVTDHIDSITETGIRLCSGQELAADIIVTATGLKLKALGGIEGWVDGTKLEPKNMLAYKGLMVSDVPNMAFAVGYTNASWTLKCDLTCEYVCRLINYLDEHGYTHACPRRTDPTVEELPLMDFSSGYIQRAIDQFPRQGSKKPWRLYQNYLLDRLTLRHADVDDGTLEFARAARVPATISPALAPAG